MRRPRWLVVQEEARIGRFVVRVMGQHHRRFVVEVFDGMDSVFRKVTKSRLQAERVGLRAAWRLQGEENFAAAKGLARQLLRGEP